MAIVRYSKDEIPPMTAERAAELKAFAETPNSAETLAEMPEWDEFDFKYAIPASIFKTLTIKERTELGQKLRAQAEAERAQKAARATIDTEKPVAVHG